MNENASKINKSATEFLPKTRPSKPEHTISAEPLTYKSSNNEKEQVHSRMISSDSAAHSPGDFQSQTSGVSQTTANNTIFRQNYGQTAGLQNSGLQNLGQPQNSNQVHQIQQNQGLPQTQGQQQHMQHQQHRGGHQEHGYQSSGNQAQSQHSSSHHQNHQFMHQHQQYSQQMGDSQYYQPAWMPSGTDKCQYLKQLLQDKKHLMNIMCLSPIGFHHLDKLLEHEIVKVRSVLFQNTERAAMALPDAEGATIVKTHKVWVPLKDNPEYNFVGRILGPRGLTAKQLEQETQCKIMVRGKGSMRDKKKEDMNRGKQNWEHLNEELHVLITVEDTENRANVKIQRAVDEINKLLIPQQDGEDDLKKKQLMELAIINGTYRDNSSPAKNPRLINHPISIGQNSMNSAMNSAMSLQNGVNNSPSVVSTVSGLAQTVQNGGYHTISPQNSVNHGYNFQTVGLNGNQVQIQRNQQLTQHQAQQAHVISQQQQQQAQQAAQQQLLGFAPVVASGPQFVRQTFVAPAQLNSPGENQVAGNGQQHPTVYYQAAEQPTQFAYATNFVPAFYPAGSAIEQSYIVQQQQAVQAQVASAQVVQAASKADNGESAESKDAMVN